MPQGVKEGRRQGASGWGASRLGGRQQGGRSRAGGGGGGTQQLTEAEMDRTDIRLGDIDPSLPGPAL